MFTPGSGACAGGASGLIIVALAPGTSAETVRSSRCWSVAVTVAMPKWLATASSPSHPVDVAAGGGGLAQGGGGGGGGRGRGGGGGRGAGRGWGGGRAARRAWGSGGAAAGGGALTSTRPIRTSMRGAPAA